MNTVTLNAGVAQLPITPPVGVELSGFVAREQPSTGVHDDLFVRALYLEGEKERLLWLHCDLVAVSREQTAHVRKALGESLGLEPRQILLTATHTHSGPATVPLRQCGAMNAGYLQMLNEWLVVAGERAAAHPQPVTLHFAEGRCTLARDRRSASPLSHVDNRLPVLALKNAREEYIALIANYPMHNVALSAGNRLISADMAGFAAEWAKQHLPGNPITLMTNGGCGNVDPPHLSADPSLMEEYGRELGEAILRTVANAELCSQPVLATALESFNLPLIVLSREQVLAEYERMASMTAMIRWQVAMRSWRDDTLALLDQGQPELTPEEVADGVVPDAPWGAPIDIQVLGIGPVHFAALSAEVFSRMADELRAVYGPRTYVVGYANGDLGYLPYQEVYAEGGYEVDTAYKFYANFMVAPGSYEMCRDTALALLFGLGATPEERAAAQSSEELF